MLSSIDVPIKAMMFPPPEIPFSNELQYNFEWICDLKVDTQQKIAFGITTVYITPKDSKVRLANLQTACGFQFEDFESVFAQDESGVFNVPVEVEIILKTASYSTTRGILYMELKGTYLHQNLLPLVNLADMILNDRKKAEKSKSVQIKEKQ